MDLSPSRQKKVARTFFNQQMRSCEIHIPCPMMGTVLNAACGSREDLMAGGKGSIVLSTAVLGVLAVVLLAAQASAQVLAPTPPMGWNSWNYYKCAIDDATVRLQADAMVSSGMRDAGYQYVNIDDCWEGERDAQGYIHPNSRFPDMKGLADYIHSKGLKLGIYSSPGPLTCAKYEGSYGHEREDAETYAAWGVDFLKYDWCSARDYYKYPDIPQAFLKMHEALVKAGRPIVFSMHGRGPIWDWGQRVGGTLWRSTGDITADYARITAIGFEQAGLEKFAGPGHWNDPDMLEVGNGKLTEAESRLHMSLWCLVAAPLISGNDLTQMSPATLAILINPEVIAVDQDPLGVQGHRVSAQGPAEVWMKPMADGSKVVGLFNREQGVLPLTVNFSEIGVTGKAHIRDLWAHKDLGEFTGSFSADVGEHDVMLIRIR